MNDQFDDCDINASNDSMSKMEGVRSLPSTKKQIWTSIFTPSWILGALLFVCLFLPSYRGCSGEAIYVHEELVEGRASSATLYANFILAWPYLLGLAIGIGTILLVATGKPADAQWLWWLLVGLIVLNAWLLSLAVIENVSLKDLNDLIANWDWAEMSFSLAWCSITVALLVLIPVTCLTSANWLNAAHWLQLALTLVGAVCLTVVAPVLLWANRVLIGGRIAIACCVFLSLTAAVQRIDGHRALTRECHESRLRLSLKSLLLLFLFGGAAFAWAIAPPVVLIKFKTDEHVVEEPTQ